MKTPEKIADTEALKIFGCKAEVFQLALKDYFAVLNTQTLKFEGQLRLRIHPLCRKERRGAEWKRMEMELLISKQEKDPSKLRFDVTDQGDQIGQQHIFEGYTEKETADWIEQMVAAFRGA